MAAPDFWNDPEASSRQSQELKNLKDDVAQINALDETYADIEAYIELGNEEEDPETAAEAKELFDGFVEDFETLRVKTLLSGEYDGTEDIRRCLNAAVILGRVHFQFQRRHGESGFSEVKGFNDLPA